MPFQLQNNSIIKGESQQEPKPWRKCQYFDNRVITICTLSPSFPASVSFYNVEMKKRREKVSMSILAKVCSWSP